jgi:glycosyltransferase involved in cell wall biosynthesis
LFISVIIPTLNSNVIHETITSLENQIYDRSNFEIIVVGIDQLNRVAPSSLVKFDSSERPLNPAEARNRGARQAQGQILAFIDADCVASPDWLIKISYRFSEPSVKVLGGGVEFEPSNFWNLVDNLCIFHDYLANLSPRIMNQLPSLNLAIKRNIFFELGGFNEEYPRPSGEDADLTTRLRLRGHTLYFEPGAVVCHKSPRNRLIDVLRHSFYQGKYSIKVDPRYFGEKGLPRLLRTRPGILLASPLIAAGVSLKIFHVNKNFKRYWYVLPFLFLTKLLWCLGASARPKNFADRTD